MLIVGLIVLAPAIMLDGGRDELPASVVSAFAALVSVLTLPATFLPGALLPGLLEWRAGKTLGKAITGISVTGVEDGKPLGLIRSMGRRAFMMIELIPIHRNVDGHLGDRLTGAIVARVSDVALAFRNRQT